MAGPPRHNHRDQRARLEAPRIRYATTSDGVAIAYGAHGSGPPLLYLHSPLNGHFAAGVADPDTGPWYRRFSERHRLILLDHRGAGRSQSCTESPSMEGYVRDVEAVLDALGLERLDVFAQTSSGCWVGAALAVKHPQLIGRLVLFQPTPTEEDACGDLVGGQLQLAEANWEMWTETLIGQVHGWRPSRDAIRRMAADWRQTESLEHVKAIAKWSGNMDVSETLKAIGTPTLVLRRQRETGFVTGAAAEVAARLIPNAELVIVPGENYQPHLDHPDELFAEIARFLQPDEWQARVARVNGSCDLSKREREVLALVATGKTNVQIAEALTIADSTAARHVHNILAKLGMSRRSEAAAWWASNGSGLG